MDAHTRRAYHVQYESITGSVSTYSLLLGYFGSLLTHQTTHYRTTLIAYVTSGTAVITILHRGTLVAASRSFLTGYSKVRHADSEVRWTDDDPC